MSGGESDNDEFVSADEFSEDEEVSMEAKDKMLETNYESDNPINTYEEENSAVASLQEPIEIYTTIEDSYQVKNYRKRPERRRKPSPPLEVKMEYKPIIDIVNKPDLKPILDIVARPDAIVSNITSHLTSNISKGFASIQETSSSIKGLVMNNLVGDTYNRDTENCSYDYDRANRLVEETTENKTEAIAFHDSINHVPRESNLVEDSDSSPPPDDLVLSHFDNLCEPSNETTMTSSITEEILKLSEVFEKLKQTRMSESTNEPVVKNYEVLEVDLNKFCSNLEEEPKACQRKTDATEVAVGKDLPEIQENPNKKFNSECWKEWDHEKNTNKYVAVPKSEVDLKNEAKTMAVAVLKEIEEAVEQLDKSKLFFKPLTKSIEGRGNGSASGERTNEIVEPVVRTIENVSQLEDQDRAVGKRTAGEGCDRDTEVEGEIGSVNKSDDLDGWDDWNNDDVSENQLKCNAKVEAKSEETEHGWDDWGDDDQLEENADSEPTQEDDGWGDWGDEDLEVIPEDEIKAAEKPGPKTTSDSENSTASKPEWSGWDSFGEKKDTQWGISGWGINSLLSKATAVTSNISAVTQGLSNVIETGLGVPDPQTMARIHKEEEKNRRESGAVIEDKESSPFPFVDIVSGVGKIVEVAKVQKIGSRVLSGGLDTLESIGKKTMEVLQEGDPGLRKKKALLMGKGQMLSDVLKEARDRAVAEEKSAGILAAGRRCHFETLFDDYQGLVHLEALEMLSRQCELRLEQIQQGLSPRKLRELNDTMEEITQLCEIDEDFDAAQVEDFQETLESAAMPLCNELSVAKIIEVHNRMTEWLGTASTLALPEVYDYAISILAELTAAVTMQFHKSGELLLLKERRKTVEEADSLLQLSSAICSQLTSFATDISGLLRKEDSADARLLTGNLRVEVENAVAYIKQAFTLLIPVLQLGAT